MFKPKGSDIHVKSRSRDVAHFLVRDHGDRAEEVLNDKLSENLSAVDRYRFRLARRELKKLRRAKRRSERKYPAFIEWILSPFKRKRRRR